MAAERKFGMRGRGGRLEVWPGSSANGYGYL